MTTLTALPIAPSRADPTNFSARGDAMMTALESVFVPQMNTIIGEIGVVQADVAAKTTTATTQASNAAASATAASGSASAAAISAAQAAASAASGGVLWVSGVTYTAGSLQYSPINNATYRRKTTGSGTVDPSISMDYVVPMNLPGVVPIGGIIPVTGNTDNLITGTDQTTYIKTGTLASSSSYPLAPKVVSVMPNTLSGSYSASAGNSIFVLIGSSSGNQEVFTSTDGENWTYIGRTGLTATLTYGVYGAGVWIFPANAGGYYRTSDFITWTYGTWPNTINPSIINYRDCLIYANSLFVAIPTGTANYVYTSSDGINWSQITTAGSGTYLSIAYGGGRYVMLSTAGTQCQYSTTGTSGWTYGGAITSADGHTISYISGNFVAVSYTDLAYSTNGVSWTNTSVPTSIGGTYNLVNNGTYLVASTTGMGYIYSSSGTSFTSVQASNIPGQGGVNNGTWGLGAALPTGTIFYGGVKGVINSTLSNSRYVGDTNTLFDSSITRPMAAGNSTIIVNILRDAARVTVCRLVSDKYIISNSSTSGVGTIGINSYLGFDGTTFVLVHSGNTTCYSSTDGITWTSRTLSNTPNLANVQTAIAAKPGRWLNITGTTTLNTSTDGVSWTTSSVTPASFSYITVANGVFLACTLTATNTYYTSTDGVSWTSRTLPTNVGNSIITALGFNISSDGSCGNLFVTQPIYINPTEAYFYTSSDGVSWTKKTIPYLNTVTNAYSGVFNKYSLGHIVIKNGAFDSVNVNGFSVTSDGGTTWSSGYASTASALSQDLNIMNRYFRGNTANICTILNSTYVGYPTLIHLNTVIPYYVRIS